MAVMYQMSHAFLSFLCSCIVSFEVTPVAVASPNITLHFYC